MTKMLDYCISPLPIRIEEAKVDPSLLRIKELTVTHFGYLPGRTLKNIGYNDNSWAFTYVVRGTGYYQAGNGQMHKLEAGTLFWEWPGTVFRYGPDEEGDWDEYYIHFHGSRVQEWIVNHILQPNSVYRIGVDNKWIRKIETIGDYLESGVPESADRAALLLESLIYDFNASNEGLKTASRDRKPEFVRHVFNDIHESVYDEWDEEQVLRRHHLSRSTLRKLVKQNTGYSLNEYVNRLKIAEAKKLLRLTTLQVKEITQMLGYKDHVSFTRLFKKYAGLTTTAFRNEVD